jgi:phosphoenolpyruvate-protein kinase (PTS system EI component)
MTFREQEQFEALEALRMAMGRRPVVVRTLDIGAIKRRPAFACLRNRTPFWACAQLALFE